MNASVTCGNCSATLEPGDRFCNSCGANVRRCAACSRTLAPGDAACPDCGSASVLMGTMVQPRSDSEPTAHNAWDRVRERLRIATQDQFEIKRELGRGGMAAVYLANEIGLSRRVAIKVMAPGFLMDESMVERFRQEAVTLANLNHAHIVPIYAVREIDDLHFFVMKYIEGRPLNEIIEDSSPLSIPVVRAILFQAASALASAHRRGIIHRDIKPANILLDTDGNAIVTDFGIAKVAEAPGQTQTGSIVGTPAYMSAEQCNGAELGVASDQYSLGVVAYEMLTGKPPFVGATLAVMHAHAEKAPPSIRAVRSECPEDLEAVVMRMLDKDPAKRWESTTQAAAAAGGRALDDDDPVRGELIALASAGLDHSIRSYPISAPRRPTPSNQPRTPPSRPDKGATAVAPGMAGGDRSTPAMSATSARPGAGRRRVMIGAAIAIPALVLAGLALRPHAAAPILPTAAPVVRARADSTPPVTAVAPPTTPALPAADPVRSVVLVTLDTAVEPGARFRLRASVRGSANQVLTGVPVRWHSTNPQVATVDSLRGLVTAGATPGAVQIVAIAGSVQTAMRVSVRAPVLAPPTPQPAVHNGAATSDRPAAVVQPPPPAPPSSANTPDSRSPSLPTALDVNPLIDACVNAFSSGKKDRVASAYGAPGTAQDSKNRDELVAATGRNLVARLVAPARTVSTGPNAAESTFQLQLTYSPNSFTRQSQSAGPYPFQLQLQRTGSEWKASGCHTDAEVKLH